MSGKQKALIISVLVVVFIAYLLIFSPILKGEPVKIETGYTYLDTIDSEDPPGFDEELDHRHSYTMNVFVDTTYNFAVSSLSDTVIVLYEYHDGDKIHLLNINAGDSANIDHTFHSAGRKIFYIESPTHGLPADYSFRVTHVAGES